MPERLRRAVAPRVPRGIDWSAYDFLDLGCSSGGSIAYGAHRFGGRRGIGVDLDADKVARAVADGLEVVQADATQLRLRHKVRFVSMLDFLEHLPSLDAVEQVVASAAECATDFLYIKHPSFEGEGLGEKLGVRQYWWNWHGHTAHIRVADYCRMFDRLGLRQYMIRYLGRIDDSTHESIVPLEAPRDLSLDEASAYADIPFVEFDPPLWRRQDIFVALRPFTASEWDEVTRPTAADRKLLDRPVTAEERGRRP